MKPINCIKVVASFSPLIAAFSLHSADFHQSRHQMMLLGGGVDICTSTAPESCLPDTRFELENASGAISTEQVALLQSKDVFSRELMLDFVRQAALLSGKEQPEVLVVTASSRNPFAAVDFYLNLFEQAGAQVHWLPIHAAYQQAQRAGAEQGCAQLDALFLQHHGLAEPALKYPALMAYQQEFCQLGPQHSVAMIENADAIFFNGGDQSMTLQALRTDDGQATAELKAIERGLAEGTLLVGGTSAGTAVMSGSASATVPMITNGDSRYALAYGAHAVEPPARDCGATSSCPAGLHELSLTYRAEGGTALFPWGILDTHFSERGREARLIQLALATDTRFGFGVDEATALRVFIPTNSQPDEVWFEVQGQGGVFIVDTAAARHQQQDQAMHSSQVVAHYLTHGDKARLQQGELRIQFADWKQKTQAASTGSLSAKSVLQADHYQQLAYALCKGEVAIAEGQDQLEAFTFSLQIKPLATSDSRHGVLQQEGGVFSFCSYQDFQLELKSQQLADNR